MSNEYRDVLIGSTFPLSLIRRKVVITPVTIDHLKTLLIAADVHSFWGHENTLKAASGLFSRDLTPRSPRPALGLSSEQLPTLDGQVFHDCWVLSPDYAVGKRPGIGEELAADAIDGWQVLHITFPE